MLTFVGKNLSRPWNKGSVKADTARKNWSISIAFSPWREERRMHHPPKSPTSAWLWRFFSKDTQRTTAGSYVFGVLNSGPPETFRKPRLSGSLGFGFEFQLDRQPV
jgi:hypothetical protein